LSLHEECFRELKSSYVSAICNRYLVEGKRKRRGGRGGGGGGGAGRGRGKKNFQVDEVIVLVVVE
jgi:hypothetical protein